MNKSDSLWVRETLKNAPFPRRRRWESLDCTHFQNMLKMKHWRFVEIRIPASCCDSRRKERSASRFDPALQIQPRFSFFFCFFFLSIKANMKLSNMPCGDQIFVFRCRSPDSWKKEATILLPPRSHSLSESVFGWNRKQKLTRHKKHYCTLFPFLRNGLINISELINVLLYYSARRAQGNIARCAAFKIWGI